MSIFCIVDDKNIPLYRVMWISALPHFCGSEDCLHEGDYEVRLEQGECVWASHEDRDRLLLAIEQWQGGIGHYDDDEEEQEEEDDDEV